MGRANYRWLSATGVADADVTDAGDFRLALASEPPAWLDDAIVYQVFPDRFARSARVDQALPEWAVAAAWDDPPERGGPPAARQLFGGDLYGVAEHLDHVADVGANTIYLTPVFPAASSHRYNASSFEHVDPLLGGDAALRELLGAAHARGLRVLGDLTTNHTGDTHDWFRAGSADPGAPESAFFLFGAEVSGRERDYVGWFGHKTLPKLDHRSAELRQRMSSGPNSVVARWLAFGLDGWRIDVANMTGRHRETDVNREVAREIRAVVTASFPDAYLVGEHFHDFLGDVDGTTWHGIMNYAGLAKPMWTWLGRSEQLFDDWLGVPMPSWPRLPGQSAAATMRAFSSIPWSARAGKHDPGVQPRHAADRDDHRRRSVDRGGRGCHGGASRRADDLVRGRDRNAGRDRGGGAGAVPVGRPGALERSRSVRVQATSVPFAATQWPCVVEACAGCSWMPIGWAGCGRPTRSPCSSC